MIKNRACMLFLLVMPEIAHTEPQLTEQESERYAEACHRVVINNNYCPDDGAISTARLAETYSYWPSKILSIDDKGAVIQAKVKITYLCTTGSNKGWGEPVEQRNEALFTCITDNVSKDSYPDPTIFLSEAGVFAYTESVETDVTTFPPVEKPPKSYYSWINRNTIAVDTSLENYVITYFGLGLAKQYFGDKM